MFVILVLSRWLHLVLCRSVCSDSQVIQELKLIGTQKLFIKILTVIIVVETMIMVGLYALPTELSPWQYALVDAAFLALLSMPVIYFLVIQPYEKSLLKMRADEKRILCQLKQVNNDLALQKRTLDEHAIVSTAGKSGEIIYVNDKFCQISGFTREELLGQNHRIVNSGYHSKGFFKALWSTISSGNVWHGDIKNRAKDGTFYWVNATIVPVLDEHDKPYQYIAIRTDITAQKRTEETLNQAQRVGHIGSWDWNQTTEKLVWSEEIYNICGFPQSVRSTSKELFITVIHPDDREYVLQRFDLSKTTNTPFDVEHRITRQDNGEVRWVHEKCVHDRDVMGNVVQSHGIVQDITERKLAQQKIKQLAMTDQLTGLANRNQFYATFDKFISMAERDSALLGVMILDLDRFKSVNDNYGHQTGDKLLHIIAQEFRENCRQIDLIARLGGDEFAIVLYKPLDKGAIREVANRIIRAFEAPMHVNGHRLQVGVSIGISIFPNHGTEQHALIENADAALYEVKRQGKNNFRFYDPNDYTLS
ncbi:hypothetical protein C6Y40_21080 [Alteromonas alba]|uniref:Sensor domain-containing diguanylate cyclase n=1 Tax=Alteromonas alba TaxID=2079529 RepID=A0A2S9V581_9ALTE|nr:hypothetical protein C6Y40_21080 [Alteromonas alba]